MKCDVDNTWPLVRNSTQIANSCLFETVRMAQQSIGMSSTSSQAKSTNNQYLVLDAYPSTQLPSDLTIAQLLAIAEDNGISLSKPCLYLTLRDSSKDPKGIYSVHTKSLNLIDPIQSHLIICIKNKESTSETYNRTLLIEKQYKLKRNISH